MSEVVVGQLVRSKAGRDKGGLFVVIGIVDEKHVEIVDGQLRKLAKPKKKKLRHLHVTPHCAAALLDKMKGKEQLLDADIRKAIASVEQQDRQAK